MTEITDPMVDAATAVLLASPLVIAQRGDWLQPVVRQMLEAAEAEARWLETYDIVKRSWRILL